MKLDLSEILCHVGMRLGTEIEEPPIVDEYLECAAPIVGEIAFSNTGNVLLATGKAVTSVVLSCGRCLEYYREPVEVTLDEQFTLEMRSMGSRRHSIHTVVEDDENPDAAQLFDGPLFDLTEALRQAITLALPSQPLHAEDCRGLCAVCGANLNERQCDCVPEPASGAFSALAALLEDDPTD